MFRASSYNIYVDLPGNSEEMLLVHGYTGAYDKVSRRTVTYVRALEPDRPPQPLYGDWSPEPPIEQAVPPSEETIKRLEQRGYLTEKTIEEEVAFFDKVATVLHKGTACGTPGYLFMPTYNCNLRCPYCYQDHIRANPTLQHLPHEVMQPELVDRIFLAMEEIEANCDTPTDMRSPRRISFYGGEPLLEQNHRIVEYIVNKALSLRETLFSAVTNATELHACRDVLGPGKISNLQITLDGPPHEHNRRRIYADGSGSFERIAQNITLALGLGVKVNVRVNIDHNNIGQLLGLADEIVARGWDRYKNFSAYTAPISVANEKTDSDMTMNSWELDRALAEMHQQYPHTRLIRRPGDDLKNQVWRILDKQEKPKLKSSYCAAHVSMYIFDPFGDVYTCWERTGDPGVRIGYIGEKGDMVLNSELLQTWRSRTVTTNPVCHKCRYAFYCGGGCAARAMNHHKEFFANYCDGFAARFRASAAEAYLEYMAGVKPRIKQDEGCEV